MNIRMGNVQFEQVERVLGYKLNKDDEKIWNEFHRNGADLSAYPKDTSCFHVFDVPKCIVFKGSEAGKAILKMFTSDKITKQLGTFQVCEQS